ncbi:uncharacterized protein M6B38_155705 [Iris pallida]|uniref:Uncharacterized protein n=1 Tax=Iris pallida TaxID=29817 RepID=A0AAX6F593_IRIPA|nr:uncharacterized protein M6B38_155705 [Iris pallida]
MPAMDYQSSSTPFASIGRSILSIRRDQLHTVDPAAASSSSDQDQELEAFQKHVSTLFSDLSSNSDELLSLSWIRKLLDTFLICQEEFRVIFLNSRPLLSRAPPRPHRLRLLRPRRQGPRRLQRRPRWRRPDPPVGRPPRHRPRRPLPQPRLPPRRGPDPPRQEGPRRPRHPHARERQGLLLLRRRRIHPLPPQPLLREELQLRRQGQEGPLPLPLLERLPLLVGLQADPGHREQPQRPPRERDLRDQRPRRARLHHELRAALRDVGAGGRDPVPGPRDPGALLRPEELLVGCGRPVAAREDPRGEQEEGEEELVRPAQGDPPDREDHPGADGCPRLGPGAHGGGEGDGGQADGGGADAGLRGPQGGAGAT